jgi:predicted NBD/HSP70 family sugar kinase
MGVILGGELRRGAHSAAGEIGQVAFVSSLNETGDVEWRTAKSGEEALQAAAAGDAAATREVQRFIGGIIGGIVTAVMVIDPELIVIGGALSDAGDALLSPLRRAAQDELRLPIDLEIVSSDLGTEAVVLGALVLAARLSAASIYGAPVAEPGLEGAAARAFVRAAAAGR